MAQRRPPPYSWTGPGPAPITGSFNGNDSGRLTGIAADPTNANTIYVAAAGGGVWKTTDGGTSWAPLTDSQITTAMGAIAVAPSNPQVIYADTGESNNSGDSLLPAVITMLSTRLPRRGATGGMPVGQPVR
jgi:hypothetical protein